MSKNRRHMLIVKLLQKEAVWSQEKLVEALAEEDEIVTQATVSRDLVSLGAVRGAGGYRLPGAPSESVAGDGDAEELNKVVHHHAIEITQAHSLVVVKSAPGHAQMVASAFDRWPPAGVVGTVAGDDTIFLAATSPKTAGRITQDLSDAMMGE